MKPLILVTNDDGIQADGINLLASALADVGEVMMVAPARQQSAVSQAISLNRPLRAKVIGERQVAVDGTPADSVFLALHEICKRPPDLVVSGINHGANLGTDLLYSGTVAAALEAASRKLPAMAVSQALPPVPTIPPEEQHLAEKAYSWDPMDHASQEIISMMKRTAEFAARIAAKVLSEEGGGIPAGFVLNINAPPLLVPNGQRWTHVGSQVYRGQIYRREDPRGIPYFWIGGPRETQPIEPESDVGAIREGYYSLTLIRPSWTCERENVPNWSL